jgi:hypothetical protein
MIITSSYLRELNKQLCSALKMLTKGCRKVFLRCRVVELALSKWLIKGRIGESVRELGKSMRRDG